MPGKSFFPKRPQGSPIFIRPNNVDVYNGHAKPKENNKTVVTLLALPNITISDLEQHPLQVKQDKFNNNKKNNCDKKCMNRNRIKENQSVTKSPSLSKTSVNEKYFVTWRPDNLADSNNVIITVRAKQPGSELNRYKPQHFFSQMAQSG